MTAKPTALGGRRPMLAGSAVGFSRNFPQYPVPQMLDVVAASSGTFTALYGGILSIYVQGAGASGLGSNGGGNKGGGGGGSSFKRIRVTRGQQLAWTVGAGGATIITGQNAGASSTVTLPNGQTFGATGGDNAGAAGSGFGGDVNSTGGAGGASANLSGAAGSNGGAAGIAGVPTGGGGGGVAGLSSVTSGFPIAYAGSGTLLVGQGGTGNDANTGSTAGQQGRVLMVLERYAARP